MVQAEILKHIEKKNRPLTARQISIALDISPVCVSRALKQMLRFGEIEKYEMSNEEAANYLDYKINRRTYIYYPLGYVFVLN